MEAWMTNGSALRALSFEELEEKLKPLIYKFSHNESRFTKGGGVPGYEPEDLEQEIRLVLLRCQQLFHPELKVKAGYEGRPSTFINFFIHAVENKLGKLRGGTDKYYRPITQLKCVGCEALVPVQGRAACPNCGGRRWAYVRGATVSALEELLHDPPTLDAELEGVEDLIAELPEDLAESARRLLRDEDVTLSERRALRSYGASDVLPPELSYQKSVRTRKGALRKW